MEATIADSKSANLTNAAHVVSPQARGDSGDAIIDIKVLKRQREKEVKKHHRGVMRVLLKKFINVRRPDEHELEHIR